MAVYTDVRALLLYRSWLPHNGRITLTYPSTSQSASSWQSVFFDAACNGVGETQLKTCSTVGIRATLLRRGTRAVGRAQTRSTSRASECRIRVRVR